MNHNKLVLQGSFKIIIKPHLKKKFIVVGSGDMTVKELKEKIELKKAVEHDSFKLGFNGKAFIEDWRPLCDYDVDRAEKKLFDMVHKT